MAQPDTTQNRHDTLTLEKSAHDLAARLPDLLVEAARVARTVAFGVHGRRRAGPGETFWQFRHYQPSDSINSIDWRRSASSDTYFVREREWEAAHTVWLWPDVSMSMDFKSHLATTTKRDRTLILMFAMADLLVRGGERIGLLGSMPPTMSRKAMQRLAQVIIDDLARKKGKADSIPPYAPLSRFSDCILLGDFLEPFEELEPRLRQLAAQGVGGHMVQVMDPAEETLPYSGRTEFMSLESNLRVVTNRAENIRDQYITRLNTHRDKLRTLARQLGWTFLIHRTDRPAEETMLRLYSRLSGDALDARASQQSLTPHDDTTTTKPAPSIRPTPPIKEVR